MKPSHIIALTFVLMASAGCNRCRNKSELTAHTVQVAQPASREMSYQFEAEVVATSTHDLSFASGGTIHQLAAKEGEMVELGAILATLESSQEKSRHDSLTKLYTAAQYKLRRHEKLLSINDITQKEYNKVQQEFTNIADQYREAGQKYAATQLVAPFSGQILKIHVQQGQTLLPGTPVLKLSDPSLLQVRFWALKEDVNPIRHSDSLIFIPHDDKRINLTINATGVTPTQENQVCITASFNETQYLVHQNQLKNGTSGRVVDVGRGVQKQLLIPESALMVDPETRKTSVWVVNPQTKTISKRQVTTGIEYKDGQIIILKGLRLDETIVISKVEYLKEGQKVKSVKK